MPSPLVSIIIVDYKKKNPYLIECLNAIQKQKYKNFEVILVTDYNITLPSQYPLLTHKYFDRIVGPAEKRDWGAKKAKGEILAFIDDDAYPDVRWLSSLVPHFGDIVVAGVGGPGVTPLKVSWQEEASGWASASPVGAGPYTYRFLPGKRRFVDDYPSMNLAVRKTDFQKVGGFDSQYWPGEDTKLCLDLVQKLGKKIVYDPKVLVHHHRRPIFIPHLRQNGNFGLHRGFFARILPKTSLKAIYFGPSLLVLGLIYLLFLSNLNMTPLNHLHSFGWLLVKMYFTGLALNAIWIFLTITKNSHRLLPAIFQSLLSIPVIFITHLWYGARFLQGFFFTSKLAR